MLRLLLVFPVLFLSCSTETEDPAIAPSGLSYSPAQISLLSSEEATTPKPVIEGTQPISFSLSGNTISQFSINAEGIVTVAAGATPGTYRPTITASNKAGSRAFDNLLTISISQALLLPTAFSYSPAISEVSQGSAFSTTAPQTNSSGPVSFTISVSPSAGNNITINSEGVIQAGSGLAPGTYVVSVSISNANGSVTFNSALTIVIKSAPASQVSFTADIKPILTGNCTGCHSNYNDYTSTKNDVEEILNRIQRQPGSTGFMPQGGQALSAAQIELIKKWKEEGLAN
ncbi:MAG: c-type cytochrome [Cyclobacteriaceae bacterium]